MPKMRCASSGSPAVKKKRIVFQRYGSLTDFRHAVMYIKAVARLLRIPRSTVQNCLRKFVDGGSTLSVFVRPARQFLVIQPRLKRVLLHKATLQQWAPFSIRERLEIIRILYREKMSYATLRSFYKAHKVSYVCGKTAVYRTYLTNQVHLDSQRQDFALLLANLVKNKYCVVYQDESSSNCFQVLKRSWSTR